MTNVTEIFNERLQSFMDGFDNGIVFWFAGKVYVPVSWASGFDIKGATFMPDRENEEQQNMFGFDMCSDEDEDEVWQGLKDVEYVAADADIEAFELFERMEGLNSTSSLMVDDLFINYALSNTFKLEDEDVAQKKLLQGIEDEECFLVDSDESTKENKLFKLAVPAHNYEHFKWGDYIKKNDELYLLSDDFDLAFYARLCYGEDFNLADALIALKYADYTFDTTTFDVEWDSSWDDEEEEDY